MIYWNTEDASWVALAHTMALFRQVAVKVGTHLGYAYPDDLHRRVRAYVEQIKRLVRSAASSENESQL